MAEPRQISFSYEEVAKLLIKQQKIHEGLWGVYFELGLGGGNVPTPDAKSIPAAVVLLQRVGIQRFDQEVEGLTVDAAKVNPATKRK